MPGLIISISINIYFCQRIHDWIYNRRRGSNSGTGTRGLLKLKSTRLLHPWQAFYKLFGEDMKSKVDTQWQEFRKENPDSTITLFHFRNTKMQVWYEESSPEVKAQVEEYRQQYKDGLTESNGNNRQNHEFQQ